jgi:hypothetical protein
MSTKPPSPVNAVELINSLDPGAIEDRLNELDREAQALRVLLRSARAREGAARRRTATSPGGGPDHAT